VNENILNFWRVGFSVIPFGPNLKIDLIGDMINASTIVS